jgi:hypothetical protein
MLPASTAASPVKSLNSTRNPPTVVGINLRTEREKRALVNCGTLGTVLIFRLRRAAGVSLRSTLMNRVFRLRAGILDHPGKEPFSLARTCRIVIKEMGWQHHGKLNKLNNKIWRGHYVSNRSIIM